MMIENSVAPVVSRIATSATKTKPVTEKRGISQVTNQTTFKPVLEKAGRHRFELADFV